MLRFWRIIAVLCAAATGVAAAASAQTLPLDAATAATLKRTPPLPARKAGVPFACTGQIARMRWKLESNEPDSAGD